MKKIIVASQNPVKINATLSGFQRMFPNEKFSIEGVAVQSGVRDQPIGSEETLRGANNRLKNAQLLSPKADYWVGLEGGVEIDDLEVASTAWIVIKSQYGQFGKGKPGLFVLPPSVASHIHDGKELGVATDIVFGRTNSKQVGGSIVELTDGLIDRTKHYEEAVIFALIPFKNPELYPLT
jgi:inosine/xanthosine triphosphatase